MLVVTSLKGKGIKGQTQCQHQSSLIPQKETAATAVAFQVLDSRSAATGCGTGRRDRIDSARAETALQQWELALSQTSLPFSGPPSSLSSASKIAFRPCPQLLQGAQLGSRLELCFLTPADSIHKRRVVRTDFVLGGTEFLPRWQAMHLCVVNALSHVGAVSNSMGAHELFSPVPITPGGPDNWGSQWGSLLMHTATCSGGRASRCSCCCCSVRQRCEDPRVLLLPFPPVGVHSGNIVMLVCVR